MAIYWEHSGSVIECLTQDRGAAGSSLTGVTVLCPLQGSYASGKCQGNFNFFKVRELSGNFMLCQ